MKCLTVAQPFAQLIIAGEKIIENRTWATRYRGPLLIHAGRSRRYLTGPNEAIARMALYGICEIHELALGAIIGQVDVVDCLRVEELPVKLRVSQRRFIEGPWCWVLESPVVFDDPVAYRGGQRLFAVHELG